MQLKSIVINLSMLGSSPTGLGVYAERCARYLERNFPSIVISSCYKPEPASIHQVSPGKVAIGSGRLAAFHRVFFSLLWKGQNDGLIYTPTHHGLFRNINQVITILDLIPVHHPAQNKFQHFYFKWLLPYIIRKSRAVFTLSETAKKEISDYYSISMGKIYVVPCGIDREVFMPPPDGVDSRNDYLLVVGASYPHKNISELLENWPLWKGRYRLKIASSRGRYKSYLQSLAEKYKIDDDIDFLGYVSDNELVFLLQNCRALVFPSLSEGFGMPPMEAMACGSPVIVSDIPVHKEIMKDAPIFITPGVKESWETAFSLLQNKSLIEKKIARGLELVQQYSWEHSGEELIKAILSAAPELVDLRKRQILSHRDTTS